MATKHLDYAGLAHVIAKLMAREFQGKGLSAEDFTTALKNKLASLPDTAVDSNTFDALRENVTALEGLIESDSNGAINKFNEIVTFLEGVSDTSTLRGLLGEIAGQYSDAASRIEELEDDRNVMMDEWSTLALKTDVDQRLADKADKTELEGVSSRVSDNATKIVALETAVGGITSITNAEIDELIAANGVGS